MQQARPSEDEDVHLLAQLCAQRFASPAAAAVIIPSLGGDQALLFTAAQIVASLRRECLAWSCPLPAAPPEHQEQQIELARARTARNVFWSLVAAHTGSYEAQHHNGATLCAWAVPAITCRLLLLLSSADDLFGTRSQFVAALRAVQAQFRASLVFSEALSGSAHTFTLERIAPLSRRWVDVAQSMIARTSVLAAIACGSQEQHEDQQELAIAVVQALLAVCVPARGIFVDRVKVDVRPASAANVNCGRGDSSSGSSSSSSSSSSSDDENPAALPPRRFAEVKRGVQVPPANGSFPPLSLEGRIVLKRAFGSCSAMPSPASALLVSCSLLEDADADAVELLLRRAHDDSPHTPLVVLICQRLVVPAIKIRLAQLRLAHVIVFDRLGIQHFPVMQQLLLGSAGASAAIVHELESAVRAPPLQHFVPCEASLVRGAPGAIWIAPPPATSAPAPQQQPALVTLTLRVAPLTFVASAAALEAALRSLLKAVARLLADGECVVANCEPHQSQHQTELALLAAMIDIVAASSRDTDVPLLARKQRGEIFAAMRSVFAAPAPQSFSPSHAAAAVIVPLASIRDAFVTALELTLSLARVEDVN